MLIKDNHDFMDRWCCEKNDELNNILDSLSSNSCKKAWFICENGHTYNRAIVDEFNKHSCWYCKSLAFNFPELEEMFTEANKGTAWDYPVGSEKIVELECLEHGKFKRVVKQITKTVKMGGKPCKKCNRKEGGSKRYKPTSENSIAVNYPELIPLWSDKNKDSIESFSYGSDHKAWWICLDKEYHPDYEASIYQRARMGTGCPCCSGRNLVLQDSFGSKYPEYVELWSDKNEKTPYEFSCFTAKAVWFKCENGLHKEYQQTISNKSQGKLCLECGRERARLSTMNPKNENNTIAYMRPDLKAYWSDKNEKTPYEYNYGSDQVVWWKCENGVHEDYQQKSSNKVFKDYRCSKCNYSRGEELVGNYLSDKGIDYHAEHSFKNLSSVNGGVLRFDFYIPDMNICVEYDGKQHFEPIEYFGGVKAYETQVKNDAIKDDYCTRNNLALLRIPYYMNKAEVEYILEEKIQQELTIVN